VASSVSKKILKKTLEIFPDRMKFGFLSVKRKENYD